jgi:hypothetical protein
MIAGACWMRNDNMRLLPLIGWILVAVSSDMLRPYHSSANRNAGVVVCALGTPWRFASGHAGLLMPL